MSKSIKYICVLLLFRLFYVENSFAQLRFAVWSNNYIEVTSYMGKTTDDRFNTFQFDLNGKNININDWSLSVRLLEPINTISGGNNKVNKPFPPEKISFQWTTESNSSLRLEDIRANRNNIFLQNVSEVMLVQNAQKSLNSEGRDYSQYQLFGRVNIASGSYLDDYLSPNQYTYLKYRVPLLFSLYDANRQLIGSKQLVYEIQLPPRLSDAGMVNADPDYSLQVNENSTTANLQFFNEQDYKNGVSFTLNDAIRVNSSTDFEVRVKAMETELLRDGGGSLPLSVISTVLMPSQGNNAVGMFNPELVLSNSEQIALSAKSQNKNKPQSYSIRYTAHLSKMQALSAQTGNYGVTVLYLLVPK
ncbi:hypothetical protein [Sphingobacterium siyangense]|uniref:hypothetical protein n=1 Tax=Sphingobacterium siyangense TaxID=459529 RepID=UPI0030169029